MAENKIEIEVELVGGQQAQQQLNAVATASQQIGTNAKSTTQQTARLGETFTAVGDQATKATGAASRGVLAVSGGLGSANDSAVTLGRAMVTLADNGGRGMIAILGPIGAVIATIYTLYEGYQQLSGAAIEYEKIAAVASAVASDLTSKLDELADKGIKLTDRELRNMISSIVNARQGIEYMNEQLAESKKVFADRILAQKELNTLLGLEKTRVEDNMFVLERWGKATMNFLTTISDFRTQQEKIVDAAEAYGKAMEREQEYIDRLAESYRTKYEESVKEQQRQAEYATTHQEALDMLKTEFDRRRDLNNLMLEAYGTGSPEDIAIEKKKLELSLNEDLAYWTSKTKTEIYAEAKARKELNDQTITSGTALATELKLKKELADLEEKKAKQLNKEADDRKKSLDASAFRARQQLSINEQSQINALRIQLEKDGADEQIALAVNTYTTQQKLNKNNKNQLIIAELQYQQQLNSIAEQEMARQQASQLALEQSQLAKIGALQEEAYKEIEIEKTKEQAKKDLTDKIALLDIQLTQTGYDQQIAMLNKQMEIELAIVEKGSLAELEIKKRYQLASKDIQGESMQMLGEFAEAQTQAFSASLATAIMTGASVKQVLKETLTGIATEALTKSIFHTAEGFASLALGPIGGLSASQHFAAAGLFAGVASVAGLAGASIPSSKASASSGASPSGMAQTTQVQRPEAQKSEPMVFNVNFSGATIYDTKESAKRALSDEIVKYMNEPRRGSPRLRVQNA